ncbi:ribonuclease E inhibitor RraB [Alteromonas sediminis]|nr:ribonuclease E inhibitor RraB [Alteromonas sediminis]
MAILFLGLSINAYAAEDKVKSVTETDIQVEQQASTELMLAGHMDEEQLKQQFTEIREKGLDLSKDYKWEFRFTAKMMSSLEDFAQYAHSLGFWPVALESDVSGDNYWLYIQKTYQYTEEDFVNEVTQLFKMAEYAKLSTFDGFSIDKPDDTTAQK